MSDESVGALGGQEPAITLTRGRRDRLIGATVLSLALVGSFGFSWWARRTAEAGAAKGANEPSADGISGWPDHVDAVAVLPLARLRSPRTRLMGFVAHGVRPDGTMDVPAEGTWARFTFQGEPVYRMLGHSPPPEKATETREQFKFCGQQSVRLTKKGLIADKDRPNARCRKKMQEGLPLPSCDLETIWQQATLQGAPSKGVAHIEYYSSRVGPAWRSFTARRLTSLSIRQRLLHSYRAQGWARQSPLSGTQSEWSDFVFSLKFRRSPRVSKILDAPRASSHRLRHACAVRRITRS